MSADKQWTDELKQEVIRKYQAMDPTPENSAEIVKEIAEELDKSPNGVRMILSTAGVYVKKGVTAPEKGDKKETTGTKRVSKESQIEALKAVITEKGKEVDEDILSKLTGKAAVYFTEILS